VRSSHERWDGSGYPSLAGAAIPLGSRIIAVADAFDAMTTCRPYSDPVCAGGQFDPVVVNAFGVAWEAHRLRAQDAENGEPKLSANERG